MKSSFITIRKTSDVSTFCHKLTELEAVLDRALAEIATLERGSVHPEDTLRRAGVSSYASGIVQQVNNYIDKKNITITPQQRHILSRIGYKSDKVLRENIVLQSKPPLDVIKFKNVPVRHSFSTYGRREQRWGYGLHTKPFNEEGDSITIAKMPPFYTQNVHNHKVSEYCLSVDSRTEGIFFPGGKREKIYTTKRSQILHFSATTPHTLRNPLKRYTRNITFKHASALTDWRPMSKLNDIKTVRARIMKGTIKRINGSQTTKLFSINDKFYDYKIEVIRLDKGSRYIKKHPYDQYIFVMNGRFHISHKTIEKGCCKNDFIVIDKNTEYTIKTDTFCRLYTITKSTPKE